MECIVTVLDWLVIGIYLVGTVIIAIWFSRRGTRSFSDFFLGGRSIP